MPLLPTELIGSYALPSWLHIVTERIEHTNDLGETDLRETLDDAVTIAVSDQERAGLDLITDGEMRRRDFIQNFYGLLTGLHKIKPARTFGAAGYDQNPRYEIVDRITAPHGLGAVAEVAFLKKLTNKPIKICVPGPMTMALPLLLKSGYANKDAVVEAMAEIINAEMKALVAAGADYLQVDEPRYASSHEEAQRLVALFNATRAGVNAKVGLHFCFGNFKGRSHDRRDYAALFPAILEANADQFNLEFANREFAQIELLKHFKTHQRIGFGVIDVKSYFVETPEEVAAGIRRALQFTSAEQLVITPDCGFNHCPRHIAFRKMLAMTEGAKIVREELA
ncbi:MAG TPA: methionine synthase [Blastocatellia bacterium]|nr:methionine synthase [Blastocatellia bacterium]